MLLLKFILVVRFLGGEGGGGSIPPPTTTPYEPLATECPMPNSDDVMIVPRLVQASLVEYVGSRVQ